MNRKNVALFGGSFDPPHNGHLQIAAAALDSGQVAEVWFMPSPTPPHKTVCSPIESRLAMTALAIAAEPRFVLCDYECRQPREKSYTIDTVRELLKIHPHHFFRLLIGADMALVFDTWKAADELIELAPPLIAARPNYEFTKDFGMTLPEKIRGENRKILRQGVFAAPLNNSASSAIRRALAGNRDYADLDLPETVAAFIRKKNLYRN